MGTQYQFTVVKMKLIVLIALIGLAAAIPNPCPEEKYGPTNGLRIPDYQPYVQKEKYGPTNGLRIPDHYYQKGYSKGYYHPRCYEEDATEEDHASADAAEVVTAEEVTPRDAESSTVNKVEHQERT